MRNKRIGPNIKTLANSIIDKLEKEGRVTHIGNLDGDFAEEYERQEEETRTNR